MPLEYFNILNLFSKFFAVLVASVISVPLISK